MLYALICEAVGALRIRRLILSMQTTLANPYCKWLCVYCNATDSHPKPNR